MEIRLPQFLKEHGMVELKQGAVKINGEKVSDENLTLESGMVLQVGKRKFLKIK